MPITLHAFSTLIGAKAPTFAGTRSTSDSELKGTIGQTVQFVMDKITQPSAATDAVLQHVQRTRHHFQFSIQPELLDIASEWAWRNNALFVTSDGSVCDPNGAVLVDAKTGEPDSQAQIPFPEDARRRKAESEVLLRNRLIDVPESLPPVLGEEEVELRMAASVWGRIQALFLVAVRAESLQAERPIPVELMRERSPDGFQNLSPWERAFFEDPNPEMSIIAAAMWRYEALYTLLWAATLVPDLPFPDTICDVPKVAEIMTGNFEGQPRLRPTSEILSAWDLNARLLWTARNEQSHGHDLPASVDGGILVERQHALHWLVQFESPDWDQTDTPSW